MAANGFIPNISKLFGAVGSVGSIVVDTVDATIDLGSKVKKAINNEAESLQTERDIENALSRIYAKSEAIKQIMAACNCSAEDAEALLEKELKKK